MSQQMHPASPKVFISSTVHEFLDIRSALHYMLKSQGLNVFMSEGADFNILGDRPALEECFNNLRDSDYFILLVGAKTGSLYDVENKVSVTRQEYREARKQFLASSRPRLLLFLRDEVNQALKGKKPEQRKVGIDDPEHLRSFIGELENPEDKGAPSFVKRFKSFEDVITSVSMTMNLGRNLTETLARRGLLTELTGNLARLVQRWGPTAFPTHQHLSKLQEDFQLTADQLGQEFTLSRSQAYALLTALLHDPPNLRVKMIEEVIDNGLFLEFSSTANELKESPIHKSLQQLLEDIRDLDSLHNPPDRNSADTIEYDLVSKLVEGFRRKLTTFQVSGRELTWSFTHFNRTENVFLAHVALCRALMGLTSSVEPYKRQPLTPLGQLEEQRIRAERVSPKEIEHLLGNDVFPFGARPLLHSFGATESERIAAVLKVIQRGLPKEMLDVATEADLKSIATAVLSKIVAPPEAGIENLDS